MMNIIANTESNDMLVLILLSLSVFRIYLEVISFDFMSLPMTKSLANRYGAQSVSNFHRFGFYMGVGYFVLHAPGFLLS